MKTVPPARDAYGREIWSFLQGEGNTHEIAERDDGYITAAPSVASYFAELAAWPRRQRTALRYLRRDRALDVGCGAGRVALHLQALGLGVTAIDNSPLAIKAARARGVTDARVLPVEGLVHLPAATYSTIVMFGNNFGLFASASKAKRLLRQMHRITAPGAVLLAESLDPHQSADPAHAKYRRANVAKGRMPGPIRVRVRHRECVGPWFDYLLASPEEMSRLVDGTGWTVKRIIRDDGPQYVGVIAKA